MSDEMPFKVMKEDELFGRAKNESIIIIKIIHIKLNILLIAFNQFF